jgi:AraC-like DNA-binding protein
MILATKLAEFVSQTSNPSRRTAPGARLDLCYAALERRQHWGNSASLMKPRGWLYVLVGHGRPTLLLENRHVVLSPGDFVIAGPECSVGWTDKPGAVSDRLVWLWRTGPRCMECAVEPNTYRLWRVNSRLWRDLEQLHALCRPEVERPDGLSTLALDQLHVAIDIAVARQVRRKCQKAKTSARMEFAEHWIAQNLAERNLTAGLCDYLQISPATLTRMFQAHHGESPASYHQRMKMARAQELLASNHRTVRDIASTLGYRHPNDFSRAFRRFTGYSPTERPTESSPRKCNGEENGSE